jgi:hypothetical protein
VFHLHPEMRQIVNDDLEDVGSVHMLTLRVMSKRNLLSRQGERFFEGVGIWEAFDFGIRWIHCEKRTACSPPLLGLSTNSRSICAHGRNCRGSLLLSIGIDTCWWYTGTNFGPPSR